MSEEGKEKKEKRMENGINSSRGLESREQGDNENGEWVMNNDARCDRTAWGG